ncbi:hypothetical protein [Thomasclavelia cocleata]|jgi:hypothetical protein|uniref:hypothetical protein n=1 Tax=Thomasclavelia cocleata TaxID=69824 RepID=UPI00255B1295|nr:hypothetical protein [Thomasclavelia cocleata]
MIQVDNKKYVKQNISKEWLIANGFHYNKTLSNEDGEVYTYRFPVYKYEGFIVLECELMAKLDEGDVLINVYEYSTTNKYAPFYYQEYGNYDKMLECIWTKINKVIKKLGIKEDGLKCWYKIMQR